MSVREGSPIFQGSAAVTFPAWSLLLSHGWDVVIAVLGVIVLVMTIYNKSLEIKQRRKAIHDDTKRTE
jgi:tetrahydromethanopterin S-methyltransferase subunit E